MADVGWRMWDVGCWMLDVGWRISDVENSWQKENFEVCPLSVAL
jgi:hypothetical protein